MPIPLIIITRDKKLLGVVVNRPITTVTGSIFAAIISGMNAYLPYDAFSGFLS